MKINAGMFKPPPRVVEAVFEYGMNIFAYLTINEAEKDIKNLQKELKSGELEAWETKNRELRLIERYSIIRKAHKYRTVKYKYIRFRAKIPLDLTDWKYVTPQEVRRFKAGSFKETTVILDAFNSRSGWWRPNTWELKVSYQFTVPNIRSWNRHVAEFRELVKHEVIHLGQSVLDKIKSLDRPTGQTSGLPSKRYSDSKYDPLGFQKDGQEGQQKHGLRDVEFYPLLAGEFSNFMRKLPNIPKNSWREAWLIWVDASSIKKRTYKHMAPRRFFPQVIRPSYFFKDLRKNNLGNWRKAVGVFYRMLEKKGIRLGPAVNRLVGRYNTHQIVASYLSKSWPKGVYLHGTKHRFDRFRINAPGYGHGLIYLSDPSDRPGRKTQAEHVADGPFGGWLAEVRLNKSKMHRFNPWGDPKAADIIRKVAAEEGASPSALESALGNRIQYEWAPTVMKYASSAGYNTFRFYEQAVRGYSTAISDPSIATIIRWHPRGKNS